jgi:pseudaminic acid cytidylyltransferase
MRVAVIPARGGSKRIPGKNIRPFCGRPMIAWPISEAIRSGCFDQVIVSTDCPKIAEVACAHGASAPFLRPADLSDDHTGTVPVIRHAVEWLQSQDREPDEVCCIYATAPFVQAGDIRRGLCEITSKDFDYAFSVTSYAYPIQRALRLVDGGRLEMFWPENLNRRSQDLEEAYHDAGQFYWGRRSAWLAEAPIFAASSAPVVLPRHRVQDIDTEEDWERAEWLFRAMMTDEA